MAVGVGTADPSEYRVMVGGYDEFAFSLDGRVCETAVAVCYPEERNQLRIKPAHKQDRAERIMGSEP